MPMLAPRHTTPPNQETAERERLESEIKEFKQAYSQDLSGVRLITGSYSAVTLVVGTSSRTTASWYDIARSFFPHAREMSRDEGRQLDAIRKEFYRPIGERSRNPERS